MLMPAELKGCVTWFMYFLDLLWVRYKCANFHHCRICMADFRERGAFLLPPPKPERPRKSPSWIGLIIRFFSFCTVFLLLQCEWIRWFNATLLLNNLYISPVRFLQTPYRLHELLLWQYYCFYKNSGYDTDSCKWRVTNPWPVMLCLNLK